MSVQRAAVTGTTARPVTVAERPHWPPVPPHPPDDDEKSCYLQRNLLYLTTILVIGSGCLIVSQVTFEAHNPALWPVALFTATYVIYQAISLPVNFTGPGFDLSAHETRVRGWRPLSYPSVDIHLPICGEPIEMLHNTWRAVADLVALLTKASPGHTSSTTARPTTLAAWPSPSASVTSAGPICAPTRRAATCDTRSRAPAANTWSSWTPTSRRGATSSPRRSRT